MRHATDAVGKGREPCISRAATRARHLAARREAGAEGPPGRRGAPLTAALRCNLPRPPGEHDDFTSAVYSHGCVALQPASPHAAPLPVARNDYYPNPARPLVATVEQSDHVTVSDDQVAVNGFTTEVREIVEYFGTLTESSSLDRKLEDALRMGVMAITATGTAQNVGRVEKEFEVLKMGFDQKIDSIFGERGQVAEIIAKHFGEDGQVAEIIAKHFGEDGQVAEIIAKHFGEDGKLLGELLNPNKPDSPLGLLKEDLYRTLGEIRDKLGEQEAARQIAGRGTQKGREFEDRCADGLALAAKASGDALDRTGDEAGLAGASRKGDFVTTLSGSGARVVFEMKDKDRIGMAEIRKELKAAMDNRDAAYGVLVAKKRSSLPDGIGWFNEDVDGATLACAVEDDEGNAVMNGEMVVMAYRWARARASAIAELAASVAPAEGAVDVQGIAQKAKEIGERVAGLSKVRRECTTIENSAEKIRKMVKDAEGDTAASVSAIIESLGGGGRDSQ